MKSRAPSALPQGQRRPSHTANTPPIVLSGVGRGRLTSVTVHDRQLPGKGPRHRHASLCSNYTRAGCRKSSLGLGRRALHKAPVRVARARDTDVMPDAPTSSPYSHAQITVGSFTSPDRPVPPIRVPHPILMRPNGNLGPIDPQIIVRNDGPRTAAGAQEIESDVT